MSANTWKCPNCGAENSTEYEICFNCGSLHNGKKLKVTKGKNKLSLISAIVSVAIVAFFLLGSFSAHYSAKKHAESGDYDLAAQAATWDILFSRDLKKDSFIQYGIGQYNSGNYTEAVDYLEKFQEDENAYEYLNLSKEMIARNYLSHDDYASAIEMLGQIDTSIVDISQLKDEAYLKKTTAHLLNGEISKAKSSLDMISSNSFAEQYLKVVALMDQGMYYDAIQLALVNSGNYEGQISSTDWESIFSTVLSSREADSSVQALQIIGAMNLLNKNKVDFSAEDLQLDVALPFCQVCRKGTSFTQVSEDELALCGNSESNKVLVVWEIRKYGTNETEYYISWDAMEQLPEDLIPSTFEEVGRVIRIVCSGYKEGWYDFFFGSQDAVREKAQVLSGNTYKSANIYQSSVFYGDTCPSSISAYDSNVTALGVFGGLPKTEIISALTAAINTVIEQ